MTLRESPFATHRSKLDGNHGAATRLKRIVLNLYNGTRWPIQHDELGGYLSNADIEHRTALLEMFDWYAQHGENDPDFMDLGRSLAKQALRAHDWDAGYSDGLNNRPPREPDDITNGYADAYAEGYDAGADDRKQQ